MGEQVITFVKIPIRDIENWIREKHDLPSVLLEYRLEEDNLMLYFHEEKKVESELVTSSSQVSGRKRRRSRKRNRMKTRGWETVARITNSKGQKCTIYKPFVDALQNQKLTVEEQKEAVVGILKSNKNKPSEESIQYFLENTLEYLKGVQ
jgi:hypothetical protein